MWSLRLPTHARPTGECPACSAHTPLVPAAVSNARPPKQCAYIRRFCSTYLPPRRCLSPPVNLTVAVSCFACRSSPSTGQLIGFHHPCIDLEEPPHAGAAFEACQAISHLPERHHADVTPSPDRSLRGELLRRGPPSLFLMLRCIPNLPPVMQDPAGVRSNLAVGRRHYVAAVHDELCLFSSPPPFVVSLCSRPCWADVPCVHEALGELCARVVPGRALAAVVKSPVWVGPGRVEPCYSGCRRCASHADSKLCWSGQACRV
jgi:hypothetical protein